MATIHDVQEAILAGIAGDMGLTPVWVGPGESPSIDLMRKIVTLPTINPDNAKAVTALRAYVDHEVFHALRHSGFKPKDPNVRRASEYVDDLRVNCTAGDHYLAGSWSNFVDTHQDQALMAEQTKDGMSRFERLLYDAFLQNHGITSDFSEGDHLLPQIAAEMAKVANPYSSYDDCIQVCNRIVDIVKEDAEKQKQPQPPRPPQPGQGNGQGSGQGSGQGNQPSGDKADSKSDGKSDGKGEKQKQPDNKGSGGEKKQPGKPSGNKGQSNNGKPNNEGGTGEGGEDTSDPFKGNTESTPSEKLAENLKQKSSTARPIQLPQQLADATGPTEITNQMQQLRHALRRALLSHGAPYRDGHSGRLHRKHLAKIPTGYTKVFRKRIPDRVIDTAVMVLLDCSGSMSDSIANYSSRRPRSRREAAASVAGAIMLACRDVGADSGLTVFSSQAATVVQLKQNATENRILTDVKRGSESFRGGTKIVGALNLGLKQLAKSKATRKMVIAVTDGGTGDGHAAKNIVREAMAAGIEFAEIGIGASACYGEEFAENKVPFVQVKSEEEFGVEAFKDLEKAFAMGNK